MLFFALFGFDAPMSAMQRPNLSSSTISINASHRIELGVQFQLSPEFDSDSSGCLGVELT